MQYEKENCFFDKCCRKGIKKGSTEPSLISFFAYNKAAHFAVGIKLTSKVSIIFGISRILWNYFRNFFN